MDQANFEEQNLLPADSHSVDIDQYRNQRERVIQIPENRKLTPIEILATTLSIMIVILTFPFSMFFCLKVVTEYERAIILRMGRLYKNKALGPGICFILPCLDEFFRNDLRIISFNVPPQGVLTKDAVTVQVDAVVYYCIKDPIKASLQVSNYTESTRLLAATTLRNVIGTHNLSELLANRDEMSHSMHLTLDKATEPWGVQVERVEIKDVILPQSMQRSMAAEAEAAREARAKIITAEGEKSASVALKEASEILAASPSALQLRYLQTLNTISAEKNTTIIFPLPMDIITPFIPKFNVNNQNDDQSGPTTISIKPN